MKIININKKGEEIDNINGYPVDPEKNPEFYDILTKLIKKIEEDYNTVNE